MPEVVCNTSPLQYLHQTGLLRLLPALYGRVLVPEAVANEIRVGLKAGVNLPDLAELDWLNDGFSVRRKGQILHEPYVSHQILQHLARVRIP